MRRKRTNSDDRVREPKENESKSSLFVPFSLMVFWLILLVAPLVIFLKYKEQANNLHSLISNINEGLDLKSIEDKIVEHEKDLIGINQQLEDLNKQIVAINEKQLVAANEEKDIISPFEIRDYDKESLISGLSDISDKTVSLEKKIHDLQERIERNNNNSYKANLILMALKLKEKIASGIIYKDELFSLQRVSSDDEYLTEKLKILQKSEDYKTLSLNELRVNFQEIANKAINSSRAEKQDKTFFDNAAVKLSSLVQIRKTKEKASGDNIEDIIARAEDYLQKSQLNQAIKELDKAKEGDKKQFATWLADAKTRKETLKAANEIFDYVESKTKPSES